ncbi:MAG: hypothetical protein V1787_02990 [Candidatus Micrarchaeota archaeon]
MAREKKSAGRKLKYDKGMLAGAVIVIVLAVIFWQPVMDALAPQAPAPTAVPTAIITAATPEATPLPFWSKYPDLMARLKQYQAPEQESRRFCDLPPEVFQKMPAFPKDFYAMKLLFELAKIQDINYFGEEYWKQPEFYPGFDEQGCQLYQYPPRDRWAAFGYGTYPSEVVVLAKRNDEFEATFFVYTSWLVQTYQGFGMKPMYPSSGTLKMNEFPDRTRSVTVDPAETQKYFRITGITPEDVLLEPAFPVFERDWTQKIKVKVKVTDAKPGKYLLGVDVGSPDPKKSDEWFWQYKLNYVSSGSQSIGQPWYTMFIEVQ